MLFKAAKDPSLTFYAHSEHFTKLEEGIQHFILDSWVKQHRRFVNMRMDKLRARCLHYLNNEYTRVHLLTIGEGGSARVIGYLVTTGPVAHFAYLRKAYRGVGVMLTVLKDVVYMGIVATTHWCRKFPLSGALRGIVYVGPDPIPQPRR